MARQCANGIADDQHERKQLILNAFVMNAPGHLAPGLWRHPGNRTTEYTDLNYWIDLAKLLDGAGFHAMFVADVLGGYDVYKGPANLSPAIASGAQFPINDPLYLVPSMAAATKNLVFGITASTTYEGPYSLARRFTTVDHLSRGRVAWNIVTSYLDSAAKNYGFNKQVEHDERYRLADEYMDVLYKLWEGSWRDDAVVKDVDRAQYAAPDRVREINHVGKYFSVPGPFLCEPSPQRTPFLFQAGTSKSGRDFGAKHAEAIFVQSHIPEKLRPTVLSLRQLAQDQYGRDPRHVKIIAGMTVIVAETDEAAETKRQAVLEYGDKEGALALFGGWTGIDLSKYDDDEDFRFTGLPAIQSLVDGWASTVPGSDGLKWNKSRIAEFVLLGALGGRVTGSPKTVVDELERWVDIADVDGFNFTNVTIPGSFEDITQFVLPELEKRGLFSKNRAAEREGLTAREVFLGSKRLLGDHYGAQFRWAAGQEAPKFGQESTKQLI
jgi:FMN-dependent oxidoreductase (nitrilotriacetate monooxygenase family)